MINLLDEFETQPRSEAGVEIELRLLKTGKLSGSFIKVKGMDSDTFLAAKADAARKLADIAESGRTVTPQDVLEAQCETLAACTVGWREVELVKGEPLEFSVANALMLYKRFPSIREQINREIGDRSNFVGG